MEVVASLSQGRTAAAQCGLFTHKSVPVIFEPPCTNLAVIKKLKKLLGHHTLHFFSPVLQANTTHGIKQSCSPADGHNDTQNMLRVFF